MPLQNFFSSPHSLEWVEAGQALILLAHERSSSEGTSNPLFYWLFSTPVTTQLVAYLERHPERRQEWIRDFSRLASWIESLPDGSWVVSDDVLIAAAQDMSWAPWLDALVRVPPAALQEILYLAQNLSPGGVKDFAEAFESESGRELLRFLEWILNERRPLLASETESWVRTPVHHEESPLAAELERAKRLTDACLGAVPAAEIRSCLQAQGLPTPPDFVHELWKLPSTSPALRAAQSPDVESLASAQTARKLWHPLLHWTRDSSWPLKGTADVMALLAELIARNSSHDWNGSLRTASSAFIDVSQTPLSPSSLGFRSYRTERSEDIRSEFFRDPSLRQSLLNPAFSQNLVSRITTAPSSVASRRAFLNLQKSRFHLSFWVMDGRSEAARVSAPEALDLLFWELQIPVISSPSMIRGVLEAWDSLRTPSDVAAWLSSKESQLDLGITLLSLTHRSGEGLRRRLENAREIVRALRREARLHADLILATRVLGLFKDSRGRFSIESTKALMALHQLGMVHVLGAVFDPSSPWVGYWSSTQPSPLSPKVVHALALHLRALIDKTPAEDLRALAAQQLRQDMWILRGGAAALMNLLHHDAGLFRVLDKEHRAFLNVLDATHSQVMLPWLRMQRTKSEAVRDSDLARLRALIPAFPSPPKKDWILLVGALARSPELGAFWARVSRLDSREIERLVLWLESGVPRRLLLWNRLMKNQKPDA